MQQRDRLQLEWKLGFSGGLCERPREWVRAAVPGAVQADYAAKADIAELFRAESLPRIQWAEDRHWWYAAALGPARPEDHDRRRVFVAKGVDYHFQIRFNGRMLHDQEGMFAPTELDLTDLARDGGELLVVIRPIPKAPAPADRLKIQASRSVKPAVGYGWDFHPRLVPLGIWDDAYVELRPAFHLCDAELRYQLSDDCGEARLTLEACVAAGAPGRRLQWSLRDSGGREVLSRSCAVADPTVRDSAALAGPELWWPNGQGPQSLYTLTATLIGADGRPVDQLSSRVGFRRVRLVMNAGAWDEPRTFPKSRSRPPMTLEINGRRIFAKGSNWVPPDMLYGRLNREVYAKHLGLARDAHFNILRVWGGGIVNKESFFELCDELGLMVWQEFPLACNDYPDDPRYLSVLDAESRAIVRRVRRHPCLALWCGGNELFNAWSGMTDQSKALRLLNGNCLDLDGDTPFLATSPVGGVGHGDYRFRDEKGREVFQIFAAASATAYCEFGCPGPASAETLRKIIPPQELFPPRPGTAWQSHGAFGAWPVEPSSWLCLGTIEHYFGPSQTLEELVFHGQLLQAEGYKCLFEEARRQKPRAAMALNWCFNEPWPCAANNSLIGWPCRPKAAYEAVKAACRPVLASARVPKFAWSPGERLTCQLYLLNDSPDPLPAGRIDAVMRIAGRDFPVGCWEFGEVPANENLTGPILFCLLPELPSPTFDLELRVTSRPGFNSTYTFCRLRQES
jgi:beta-mannosidase